MHLHLCSCGCELGCGLPAPLPASAWQGVQHVPARRVVLLPPTTPAAPAHQTPTHLRPPTPCPQDTHVCHHLFSTMPHYHAQVGLGHA